GGIASGHHHHGAARDGAVDRVLRIGFAGAVATEAEVDHFGRRRVVRHAGHGAARGPGDRVGDVGGITAAAAEHAHRQHLRIVRDTDGADAVVAHFRDGAGGVAAVPAAVLRTGVRTAVVGFRVVAAGVVAVVERARHAVVGGAARDERIGDEVVTLQQVRVEVGVRHHARVQVRDDHAIALRRIPRHVGANAAVGVVQVPLLGDEGIVEVPPRGGLHHAIHFDGLHGGVGLELGDDLVEFRLGELALELHQVATALERTH